MKRLAGLSRLLVIITVVIGSFLVPTVFWKHYKAANGNLFAQWNRSDSPGCSLGVSKNGVLVYERAYGMANLEFAGSVSHRLIALLRNEGKESRSGLFSTWYLPKVPLVSFGAPIAEPRCGPIRRRRTTLWDEYLSTMANSGRARELVRTRASS